MEWRRKTPLWPRQCYSSLPFLLSLSIIFQDCLPQTQEQRCPSSLWKQPSHKILPSSAPQPGPCSVAVATQHPRTWSGGLVVCWLWCVEGGAGGAWCHLVAWRGPIKPWENYVTFCWAGPFRPIEVQWIESCREVIFSLSCVCVWEKAGGEKKREGLGSKSIVDMLMLLTISRAIKMSWSSTSKTSAPGPSHSFSLLDANDLVPRKFDS